MKKNSIAICLAAAMILGSYLPAVTGTGNAAEAASVLSNKSYAQPEDLGVMVQSVAALDSAYGTEDGARVMYTTTSGTPAAFNVVDLVQNKLLRSFPLPGVGGSWSHTVDASGNVYISGTGKLFRYSPQSKTVTDLGAVLPGAREVYGLSTDGAGNVYGGIYPDARVFQYNVSTGTFRDYGSVKPGQDYVRSLAYANGSVYAGIGSTGSLIKMDPVTGAKTTIPFPQSTEYDANNLGFVYDLDVVGNYLFVHVSSQNYLFVYDLTAQSWLPVLVKNYKGLYVSPEKDGKVYFPADGTVRSFNLNSHAVENTGVPFGSSFRHSGWAALQGDPDFPGESLVTVAYGGTVTVMNFTTNKIKSLPAVVQGQPTAIQTLEKGVDNKLYVSGYMGTMGAQYDPATGAKTLFNLGQSEGITSSGNHVYFGTYPGGNIQDLDITKPVQAGVNPSLAVDLGEDQDRPFAMIAADNKLITGTIPTYGQLGGAVSIMDLPLSGSSVPRIYRNVVQDQSVIGLAYKDGKIYGSTSVWGGLGIDPTQSEAKIFVMDAATGAKLSEVTPELPGAVKAKAIGGLSFGPDGLLWGAAYGTIFAMDPVTLKVVKNKVIQATDWNFNHMWRPIQMRWSSDGLLYTTLASTITVVDPATLEHKTLEPTALMTLGADGHIYYAEEGRLYRIKVTNVPPQQVWEIDLPVTNPGFEEPAAANGIPGWQPLYSNTTSKVSFAVSGEKQASGANSLKMIDTATDESVAVQSAPIEVRPGVEYSAKAKLFIQSGRTSLLLRYFDGTGKQVGDQVTHVSTGIGSWQDVIVKSVAPATAKTARIIPVVSMLYTTTSFYDDIRLTYKSLVAPPVVVTPAQEVVTNDATPAVTVKAAAGTKLTVLNGTEAVGTGTGAGDTPVEIVLAPLAEGVHSKLTTYAEDAQGNRSLSVSIPAITVDLTAPAAPIVISPTKPQSSPDRTRTVSIQAEAGSTIRVLEGDREVGSAAALSDQPTPVTVNLPKVGVHKLTAVAVDAAGNTSATVRLPNLIVNNGHGDNNNNNNNDDDNNHDDGNDNDHDDEQG
jgi:hypothetical protein